MVVEMHGLNLKRHNVNCNCENCKLIALMQFINYAKKINVDVSSMEEECSDFEDYIVDYEYAE